LDLEFNQPSGNIVQIGAVVGDLATGQVLSRFSHFVNPNEPLSPYIQELCGITPAVLSLSEPLDTTYQELLAWLAPFKAERQLNPLTWGGGDSDALVRAVGERAQNPFGRRWLDVKTVYIALQTAKGVETSGGLKSSMRKVGLRFIGRPHDAADDAHNTFLMYCQLLRMLGTVPSQPGIVEVA
jgi:inhibitor of KinA sporulation pathway (predicted exonuclease)